MSRTALGACVLLAAAGCGSAFRPFATRPIVWTDDDRHPFEGPPPSLYTDWAWDMFDNTITRPASDALRYERGREAMNVNALDEVPDSSWYTNRLSRRTVSLEELALGACSTLDPPPPPYVIVHGKTGGTTTGAVVEASDGHRYVMKADLFEQPERGTAGDAIGTRFLYAAGYDVPCDFVTEVSRADLSIRPGAPRDHDGTIPYTDADLDAFLAAAIEVRGGARRISLSRYIDGDLLGGFRFEGVRDDDPNDVVPHEHRRELRAFYVLSAWLNHVDVRAENNVDVWVATREGRGYIHHMVLDAGDSLGIIWDSDIDLAMSRRFGNAHYLDVGQILGDIFGFGAVDRAYRDPPRGVAFSVFGFFDVERFDPADWRSGYSNAAFDRRTEADMAWMARVISRFDERQVRTIVRTGRFSRTLYDDELVRILMGRRARILERYLVRLSPLSFPELEGDALCTRDLAVESGLREASDRAYRATRYEGIPPVLRGPLAAADVVGARICVDLPSGASPRYEVIDLFASTRDGEQSHPARVHIATSESGERTIVGLERPDGDGPP